MKYEENKQEIIANALGSNHHPIKIFKLGSPLSWLNLLQRYLKNKKNKERKLKRFCEKSKESAKYLESLPL